MIVYPKNDYHPLPPTYVGQGRNYPLVWHGYAAEILGDPAFRWRHPHMHVHVVPLELLASIVVIVPPDDPRFARDYNNAKRAFEGLYVPPHIKIPRVVVVAVPPDSNILELRGGAATLQAARDVGKPFILCRILYNSQPVNDLWWSTRPEDRY